jgi:hypothetical protein
LQQTIEDGTSNLEVKESELLLGTRKSENYQVECPTIFAITQNSSEIIK